MQEALEAAVQMNNEHDNETRSPQDTSKRTIRRSTLLCTSNLRMRFFCRPAFVVACAVDVEGSTVLPTAATARPKSSTRAPSGGPSLHPVNARTHGQAHALFVRPLLFSSVLGGWPSPAALPCLLSSAQPAQQSRGHAEQQQQQADPPTPRRKTTTRTPTELELDWTQVD
jgi:hypothetical protein